MRRHHLNPVGLGDPQPHGGRPGGYGAISGPPGFRRVTFSYPVTRLHSSYLGFAEHYSVDFTPEELYHWFGRIKELKAVSPLTILNPNLGLTDLQRQLEQRPGRFPCLAGYKYFLWTGTSRFPAAITKARPWAPLEEIHRLSPIRDGCQACTLDCYRDPSVYQYLAVSMADGLSALRRGHWLQGLGALLHPYNFLSWPRCWKAAIGCGDEGKEIWGREPGAGGPCPLPKPLPKPLIGGWEGSLRGGGGFAIPRPLPSNIPAPSSSRR